MLHPPPSRLDVVETKVTLLSPNELLTKCQQFKMKALDGKMRMTDTADTEQHLATEMTNYNVENKDLYGEAPITTEHVQNNTSVREMLVERGISPEDLPPADDIKAANSYLAERESKLE